MPNKNPTKKNTLAPPLRNLKARDLSILSRIPISRIQGFIKGRFKPNEADRKKLTTIAVPFYAFNELERTQFILRKKYKILKSHLTDTEKENFIPGRDDYGKKIEELLDKYWDKIQQGMIVG